MNQKDIEKCRKAGIKIIRDHSRDFAEFQASRNGVIETYKFRIQFQDKNGKIQTKDSSGKVVNCSEFTADDIIKLCNGQPVLMSYTTTSDVERNHVVMLGKCINQFGKESIRPLPV